MRQFLKIKSKPIFDLLIIMIFSIALRIIFFSGFILGDDPAYGSHIAVIKSGSYPIISDYSTFAVRPLLLYSISFPIIIFGWEEWSYVFTIMIASFIHLILIYYSAYFLSGRAAALISALIFSTFPLDVILSTTLSNDILLSLFLWSGAFILLFSFKNKNPEKCYMFSIFSGFIIGLAIAIKLNAIIAPILFIPLIFYFSKKYYGSLKSIGFWMLGWILAYLLICFFFILQCNDPFAHVTVEMDFNSRFISPAISNNEISNLLLFYPKLITGLNKCGYPDHQFMPYGYIYLLFFISLPFLINDRFKVARIPAYFALSLFLMMEFAPLKIYPQYIPIHRLPRFLYIIAVPSILTIALIISRINKLKKQRFLLIQIVLILSIVISSFYWTLKRAQFYQDTVKDQRWAWNIVKDLKNCNIYTDDWMMQYLKFRSAYKENNVISSSLPQQIPKKSIILAGGSRNPDLSPEIPLKWKNQLSYYHNNIVKIFEAPYPLNEWRLSKLEIFIILNQSDINSSFIIRKNEHLIRTSWENIGEIDVGNPMNEDLYNYKIVNQSWQGIRNYKYHNKFCTDDGRGYNDRESFLIKNVSISEPLQIIKRYDASVINQIVDVYCNSKFVGKWIMQNSIDTNTWSESSFIVESNYVTEKSCLITFIKYSSGFDINSFYYWIYQPY